MKMISLLISVLVGSLLSGCAEIQTGNRNQAQYLPSPASTPTSTSPIEESKDPVETGTIEYYRVLQVLENGDALVFKCKNSSEKKCRDYFDFDSSEVGYIPRSMDPMMYDDKVVTLKNPKVINTFRYKTKRGYDKTVPVLNGDMC